LCIYCIFYPAGVAGQYAVTIVSTPAGNPVSGYTNTFDYPILSNVTLTCMVDPSPPANATYQWNTAGCFTNYRHNTTKCFPVGSTAKNVTGINLLAKDAGTITCTVTTGGDDYTSRPLTLRISGKYNYVLYIYIYSKMTKYIYANTVAIIVSFLKIGIFKTVSKRDG